MHFDNYSLIRKYVENLRCWICGDCQHECVCKVSLGWHSSLWCYWLGSRKCIRLSLEFTFRKL